jgi:RecJ-like exonuclease
MATKIICDLCGGENNVKQIDVCEKCMNNIKNMELEKKSSGEIVYRGTIVRRHLIGDNSNEIVKKFYSSSIEELGAEINAYSQKVGIAKYVNELNHDSKYYGLYLIIEKLVVVEKVKETKIK